MYNYNVLKDAKFKAGPYNDKREYDVKKGQKLVVNQKLEQLEKDGILELTNKTEVK